jgi:dTDP-4-dehydrorhamnose reductase
MKVLVFGGTGLLGSDITEVCKADHEIISAGSADADITDFNAVYDYVKAHRPEVVINCAALTDVDKCEENPDLAFRINAMGPKNIAVACRDFNARLIHLSTDYVFDGKKGDSYTEFDQVNPISVYGRSKLAGEQFVQMGTTKFMIVRTAWIFGTKRRHFVDYVIESINKGEEIIAVKDMVSSPTFSHDLAETMNRMIMMNQVGIFHAANKGYCSRVQMVEEIMKILKKQTRVQVLNQSQWKRPAARPAFSALKNYHLSLMNEDNMAGWRDALKRYIKFKYQA